MPARMVSSTLRRQKYAATPTKAAIHRASIQVLMNSPCCIKISGTTTAERHELGVYARPRWAHWGGNHSRLEMKKKLRVTTVTTAMPAITAKVHTSAPLKKAFNSLMRGGPCVWLERQQLWPQSLYRQAQDHGRCNGHHNVQFERQVISRDGRHTGHH